ncbi:unnamed protein product [Candidula unifasciata]|uniref:Thioredoxin domain-containing protein n=1 Tax=Candidula unifasciata TaxID=100452 RepID=A0A8S3ZWN3_9EUPU|nr:unnamed protein product [Candidula unifasciata]
MSKPTKAQDPSSSKKHKSRVSSIDASTVKNTQADTQDNSNMKTAAAKPKIALHPLEQLLGTSVKNASGLTVNPKSFAVENGVLGLYFAANWCPPCRTLTPKLALLYDELKTSDRKFEVVFISFDYSQESFTQYFSKMPWYALDYSELDKRVEVAEHFDIKGIPVLIVIDANSCEVITLNGREMIALDPKGSLFPWKLEEAEAALDTLILQEAPASPANSTTEVNDSKPPETGNKPPETGNKPPETGNKPSETGNKPPDAGNKPPEEADKSPEEIPTAVGDSNTE